MRTHTFALNAVLLASPVLAQVPSQEQAPIDREAIVTKHLSPVIDAFEMPGAMVGLYHDGELTFHAIGTLNFDIEQAPDESTIYEIGSIGKVFTGVFFADAIRRGEVTKHTKLQELVPEGTEVIKGSEGTEIELWHLTTHTSGWATVPFNLMPSDPDRPFSGYTEEMLYAAHAGMPLNREPGTEFEYSNFAVGTLGTVLARNAGGDYEALVQERILAPLGIDDFAIVLDEEQQSRLAPATNGGLTVKPWGDDNPLAPAGLWSTTAPQLMGFAMANLKDADEQGDEVYESLTAAREVMFDSGFGKVGFGWMRAMDGSSYWHNGQTGGYSSYMGLNREYDAAVVLLANGATFYTTAAGEKIFQELLGLTPEPVQIDPPEQLEGAYTDRLLGTYNSEWGFAITITSANGFIYARVTNQGAYRVNKVGDDRFRYGAAIDAELQFELPEDEGSALSVTLFQNGAEMKCVRVEE
jgi:D-alanyl-D-alanine-carboxypeptidase/D-alanyl-D-alanine-endopeptidase